MESQQTKNRNQSPRRPAEGYARYSGLAVQMGITILVFALLGQYFDDKFEADKPYFTVALSLFGLIGSFFYFYKELTGKKS